MKTRKILVISILIITIEIVQLIIFGWLDTHWLILPALLIGFGVGLLVSARVFSSILIENNLTFNDKERIISIDPGSNDPTPSV